jgi:hypothetical protein
LLVVAEVEEVVNLQTAQVEEVVVQVLGVFYMEHSRFLHYHLGQS